MELKFEYTGRFEETPLPEALETINRYRVPGVLVAAQAAVEKRIYIKEGDIIFATSNLIPDSLGDYLKAEGRITAAQYDESVRRLKTERKRQGAVLVEMGLLTPKELFTAVRDQVTGIVWKLFDWETGTFTFTVGNYKDDEIIKLGIPTRQAIVRGIGNVTNARRLMARVGPGSSVLERSLAGDWEDLGLREDEVKLLQMVDGDRTLSQLCKQGPFSSPENAKLLYAYFVLRIISVQSQESKIRVRLNSDGRAV